tara:strand:- start:9 stop:1007 length:999 start_codon:yes stop_codon:yes gene_type:complete
VFGIETSNFINIIKKIDLEGNLMYNITTMSNQVEKLIINAVSFDADTHVKYAKPKINKSGGKGIALQNVETNSVLNLSTPLILTWGVNEYVDEASGRKSYNMSLQFPQEDYKTEPTSQFLSNMIKLQDKIKNDAVTNCKDWFNKTKMSSEVVDALFHPMLQYPKDPTTGEPDMGRSPTLRIKLDYWDEKFNCEIFDVNQEMIFPNADDTTSGPMELIPKGTNVATVIRCGGLWFANGKFGVTWKLEQAVVKPRATFKGKCMIKLSVEEADKLNKQTVTADDERVEDSDEETVVEDPVSVVEDPVVEDPAPVVEDPVTVPVKKVKKVVRRKKA